MKKMVLAVVLALAVLFVAIPVFAQDGDVSPEVPLSWIHEVWVTVTRTTPIALVTAFVTCLWGYLSKTDPEKFRLDYFVYTILISFTIGVVTVAAKWDYAAIEQWLANGFATWWIWKTARIIAKKLGWQAQVSHPATGPGPPTPTA